jgi:hypothetical protein
MTTLAGAILANVALTSPILSEASAAEGAGPIARLIAAYPEQRLSREGNDLVWPDNTRMRIDDGKGLKPFEAWLANPDIEDMLQIPYPAGAPAAAPEKNADPGRARNQTFFDKMYGDCRKGSGPAGVQPKLKTISWLPKKIGQRLEFSSVNGAASALEAVSKELDELPADFDKYLYPAAGTYNCRMIAGTDRPSAHGHGIAIDIAVEHTSYWRWSKPGPNGDLPYKNEIRPEIVRAFEKHGFIWGGRWYHYDTMHFEYRPELLADEPLPAP